ncbi:MAG: DDE-type integrase/transposase/recombinase, partial [Gammaproteobacteria bacterium]|nr:DDE-type integrase/transposase/recombinase [Gammaproteobacteria bacterium]
MPGRFPAFMAERKTLGARTETIFSVKVPSFISKTLIIDSTPLAMMERGLFLAKTVCTVQSTGTVPIRVMNVTDRPVTLYNDQTVAWAQTVDDDNVVFAMDGPDYPGVDIGAHPVDPISQLNFDNSIFQKGDKARLLQLLIKYKSVFSSGPFDIGRCGTSKHSIPTTSGTTPIKQRPHRLPAAQRPLVNKMVKDMLDQGIVSRSSSPWASPIVLVQKKDGSSRFCIDFRRVNQVIKHDSWPLPRVDDILDQLGKAKYFSTLDLASGYWQIELDEKDREKTAFVCSAGLFEFNVLPFGLASAPAAFQRLMETTLAGLQWKSVLIYIDDLIVYSETIEQHLKDLEEVFIRLKKAKLKLKPKKCEFGKAEVGFLGHVISAEGVKPDPAKLSAVKSYKVPSNVTEIRQFLGLCGFYRRFVQGFSSIAGPLFKMLKKDQGRFVWSTECQTAFETLRDKLVTPPVLAHPDFTKMFVLTADASVTGLGAILSQKDESGKEKPVAYASRTLTKAERNYAVVELEALGVVWAVAHFRCYLFGRHFEIYTDHSPLKWIMTTTNPSGKLQRWSLALQEYDFSIFHKPGKSNANADALSRVHTACLGELAATVGERNLPDETNPSRSLASDLFYVDSFRDAQRADEQLAKIFASIESGQAVETEEEPGVRPGRYATRDGVLVHIPHERSRLSSEFPDQLVIPVSHRQRVLQACHDDIFSGHLGFHKVYRKIMMRFYWPNLKQVVKDYIHHCPRCQAAKDPPQAERAPLVSIPVGAPWDRLGMDILGPLPTSVNGNKVILVFTDYLTKWTECFCLPDQKASTVARALVEGVICRHSCPVELLSDCGTNFLSAVVQHVCELFRVKKVEGTPFHPQTDGLTERYNATLVKMLSFYVNEHQNDWDEGVAFVQFAYRTSPQASTNETPYFLMYGRDARLPLDAAYQAYRGKYEITPEDYARECTLKVTEAQQLARLNIEKAQERQRRNYDKRTCAKNWAVGDVVYKHNPAVAPGLCKKFVHKWLGPFVIPSIPYPNVLLLDHQKERVVYPWV